MFNKWLRISFDGGKKLIFIALSTNGLYDPRIVCWAKVKIHFDVRQWILMYAKKREDKNDERQMEWLWFSWRNAEIVWRWIDQKTTVT